MMKSVGGTNYSYYRAYYMYSERQPSTNRLDPDKMPQNAAYDQGVH